jgi:hypothetical protein
VSAGVGGAGGGAAGVTGANAGLPGTVNTGGGGSGASNNGTLTAAGGAGGKGVVIVRQLKTSKFPTTLTGAEVLLTSTEYVFVFNNSGTIAWAA